MTMTTCSISGMVSIPSGNVGFGREPGFRIGPENVVGVGTAVVPGGNVVLFLLAPPELFDDEHALSATPAPSAPSPLRSARRLIPDRSSSTTPFLARVAGTGPERTVRPGSNRCVPWCVHCNKFLTPSTVRPDATCP